MSIFNPRHILVAALLTLTAAGCGGNNNGQGSVSPEDSAVLRVENNNTSDMRVYVRTSGGAGRFRVGIATALSTTSMKIPRSLVTGVTDIVFELDPIGGGRSAFTERVVVHSGEEIVLRVSP